MNKLENGGGVLCNTGICIAQQLCACAQGLSEIESLWHFIMVHKATLLAEERLVVCVCVCMCACMCVYMCVCMHVCKDTHSNVYIYVFGNSNIFL